MSYLKSPKPLSFLVTIFSTFLLVSAQSFAENKTQTTTSKKETLIDQNELLQNDLLVGKWHCVVNVDLGAAKLSIDLTNQFNNDKTAIGKGLVRVTNPMISMDLAYEVLVAQTWKIDKNTLNQNMLFQNIVDRKITSLNPSFYESLYNTEDFLIPGTYEETQIISLTEQKMIGLYYGQQLNCNKL